MRFLTYGLVSFFFFIGILITIMSAIMYSRTGYFGFNSFMAMVRSYNELNTGYFSVTSALNAFVSGEGGDIILNAVTLYLYPTIRLLVALIVSMIDYLIIFFTAFTGLYNQPLPPTIPITSTTYLLLLFK